MMCVWVLVFLLTPAPTVGDCPWRFKSLYSAHGNLNAFHKSVRVRSLMHCVHLCLSISRCGDVHFSRFKCVMFTNQPVESLKRCFGVFNTRRIVWPQQFLLQRSTKTRHLTNGRLGTKSRMINPRKSLKKQALVAGSADKATKTFLETYRSGHAIEPAMAPGETISKDTSLIPTSNLVGNTPTLKHIGGYINDNDVQDRGYKQDIIKPTTGDGQFKHSQQERSFETKQAKGPMPMGDRANEIPSSGHHGNVNEMSTLKEKEPLGNLGSNSYGSHDEEMTSKAMEITQNKKQINGQLPMFATHHNKIGKIPTNSLKTTQSASQRTVSNALTVHNGHHINGRTLPTVKNRDHLNSRMEEVSDEEVRHRGRPNISDTVNVTDQMSMPRHHISTGVEANDTPNSISPSPTINKAEKTNRMPSSNTNPSMGSEMGKTPISSSRLRGKKKKEDNHGTSSNVSPHNPLGADISQTLTSSTLPAGDSEHTLGLGSSSNTNPDFRIGPEVDKTTYASSPLRGKTGKENDQVSSNLNRNNHMGIGASQKPTSSSLLKDQAGEDVGQQSSSDLHLTLHTRTEASQKPTSNSLLKDLTLDVDVTPSQDKFAVNRKSKQGKAAIPAISNNAYATTRRTNQISATKPFLDRATFQQTTAMTASTAPTSTEVACPLWPENKLRPPTTRRMTKDLCEQQDGFTFLTNTSMCIKYIEQKYTWLQARRRCWEETGDLVLIDTEEKKAECHDFLLKRGKVPLFNIKRYWIGLQVAPCGIKWVDGSPFLLDWVKKHPTRILCVVAIAEAFRRVIKRNCKTPAETVMCEIV